MEDKNRSKSRSELIFSCGNKRGDQKLGRCPTDVDLEIILLGPQNHDRLTNEKSKTLTESFLRSDQGLDLKEFDPFAPDNKDDDGEPSVSFSNDTASPGQSKRPSNNDHQPGEEGAKPDKEEADDRLLKKLERRYRRNKAQGEENVSVDYMDYF